MPSVGEFVVERTLSRRSFLCFVSAVGVGAVPFVSADALLADPIQWSSGSPSLGDVALFVGDETPKFIGNVHRWRNDIVVRADLYQKCRVGIFLQAEEQDKIGEFCIVAYQTVKHRSRIRGEIFLYDSFDHRDVAKKQNRDNPIKGSERARQAGLTIRSIDMSRFIDALTWGAGNWLSEWMHNYFHAELNGVSTYDLISRPENVSLRQALSEFPQLEVEDQHEDYIVRQAINYIFYETHSIRPFRSPIKETIRTNRIEEVAMKLIGINSIFESLELRLIHG